MKKVRQKKNRLKTKRSGILGSPIRHITSTVMFQVQLSEIQAKSLTVDFSYKRVKLTHHAHALMYKNYLQTKLANSFSCDNQTALTTPTEASTFFSKLTFQLLKRMILLGLFLNTTLTQILHVFLQVRVLIA